MTTTPDLLKRFADRMERIKTDIKALQDDLKDLKAEMKSSGINEKAVDKLVAIRMKPKGKADAQIELFQDMLTYAPHVGVHMDLEAPDSEPTPLEQAIGAAQYNPETGEVFDPVRRMAEGLESGDERIQRAAKFPPGTEIHITPSSSRTDWPSDLPTSFVAGADGRMRTEGRA